MKRRLYRGGEREGRGGEHEGRDADPGARALVDSALRSEPA
jgi:hypothetical protein